MMQGPGQIWVVNKVLNWGVYISGVENKSFARYLGAFALIYSLTISSCWSPNKLSKEYAETKELFPFGVIADCQYCSDPGEGIRKYSMSIAKLSGCVRHFNKMDLKYIVHLGDFIDRDYESFDEVIPIYKSLKAKGYHVLGNHDFSVPDQYKESIPKLLDLKSRYYHFVVKKLAFYCPGW